MRKCYVTWHSTSRKYETTSRVVRNENSRLRIESETLLKVTKLLSVQQKNTQEINNKENIIAVTEISKNKKAKLNHRQNYKIPLTNSFEILTIEECQDKPEPTDKETSMSPSFDHAPSKKRQKKQSTKHNK